MIGYPRLKPHDLRHGVAMEVLEQRHDLEQVRAPLGHARIDTTQIYTMIRPAQFKASGVVLRRAGKTDVGEFSERRPFHVRGTFTCSSNTERKTSIKLRWWSQRDLNPCLSLESAFGVFLVGVSASDRGCVKIALGAAFQPFSLMVD